MLKPTTNDIPETMVSRRRVLGGALFWASCGIVVVILGVIGGGVLRFLYPRALYEASKIFKVGRPESYKVGSVNLVTGRGVWIVREQEGFYAILAKCTHLGCQPIWYEDQQVFKCPCHGSRFHKDGVNFAGPAPRPLDRLYLSLASDGHLEVDKGKDVGLDYKLKV
ncbi:MAG TPA: ubiquinol-cytochrome c reductase iron-sulfur subunit [Candidatus Hypogeohydataceae bacterium YC38]|nr:ubiquinol-cytochrome c reductase iron-sulfur subunit [Candidatus Brocadiales bacterium]